MEEETMLKATAKGWLGTHWQISGGDDQPAIALELASIRSQATWNLDGQQYRVFRERAGDRPFVLTVDGQRLASATRTSFWRRTFRVSADGGMWTLAMTSAWRGRWELSDGAGSVGSIQVIGLLQRSTLIDLPDTLPIPLRIFMAAMVLLFARDDTTGSVAGVTASTAAMS
jgi:hypothetical protein